MDGFRPTIESVATLTIVTTAARDEDVRDLGSQ